MILMIYVRLLKTLALFETIMLVPTITGLLLGGALGLILGLAIGSGIFTTLMFVFEDRVKKLVGFKDEDAR